MLGPNTDIASMSRCKCCLSLNLKGNLEAKTLAQEARTHLSLILKDESIDFTKEWVDHHRELKEWMCNYSV